ncbi:MAG: hydrogenase iron-sulfur subunit [Anaerolineales bacterium]|nr:hydrogenase iron-sulfur subunit [Anaerolineales bacterium]
MPGDCHYLDGNTHAANRVKYLQSLLEIIGINPERVQMYNVSAAMAAEFMENTKTMVEKIKSIGHNPLKSDT